MASSGHRPLRLVLDTNVVIAGLLWSGPPRRLIEMAVEGGKVELFGSPMLIDELTLGLAERAARRLLSALARARAELAEFTRLHGAAAGRLAGRSGDTKD